MTAFSETYSTFVCLVDRASRIIFVKRSNTMHCFPLYFVTTPPHVLGPFVAHHQDAECIMWQWYCFTFKATVSGSADSRFKSKRVPSGFGGLVGSMVASGTEGRGFKPDRSRRIFRAKKFSACLPSEGK
jgi:hypothetical protein